MKNLGLLLILIVLITVLSNVATIASRQNGFPDLLGRLFPEEFADPEKEIENKAVDAGVAPFETQYARQETEVAAQRQAYKAPVAGDAKQVDLNADKIYQATQDENSITAQLDLPHRNEGNVNKWVADTVPDILAFSINNYQDHLKAVSAYMNPNAIKEFNDFMVSSKVLGLMQTHNYEMKGFLTDVPTFRTSGALSGRYRWVYDIPVNLTFLPIGTKTYKDLDPSQYMAEEVSFRLQLGRVAQGGKDGIEIETWEVLKRKADDGDKK